MLTDLPGRCKPAAPPAVDVTGCSLVYDPPAMHAWLDALQNSAFSAWVVGSDSIWAYPMILTMHTVGLGIVVGAAVVLDFRLLGIGPGIPLDEMKRVFPIFWVGFTINLVSGVMLFVSEAADKAAQPVFLLKLTLIVFGVIVTARIRRLVFGRGDPATLVPPAARRLAMSSLVFWAGAIVAGRLMAYLK
jgi:hypothetical protein